MKILELDKETLSIKARGFGEEFDLNKHPQVRLTLCTINGQSTHNWEDDLGHGSEGDHVLEHAGVRRDGQVGSLRDSRHLVASQPLKPLMKRVG